MSDKAKQALPVIMIHGWGQSGAAFELLHNELTERFQIHIMDLPGHGQEMESAGPYTYERYITEIQELALKQFPNGFHMLGWSMGGSIAGKYALDKIEPKPESLILVCAPARFVARNGSGIGIGQHPGAVKKMRKLIKSNPDLALRGFVQTFFEAGEVIDDAMADKVETLLTKEPFPAPTEVLIQTLNELDKTDLTQHNGAYDGPVLLIRGALDKICPSGGQKLWDDLFTRIDRVKMPDCGHAPHLTRPRELAREISRFLSNK